MQWWNVLRDKEGSSSFRKDVLGSERCHTVVKCTGRDKESYGGIGGK